ncbi:hypothetical protein [Priestia endophytica]|uniref:Uncharacterized protein n=2 Tax=Priestia endophytica TaxID=135735 RepID=A0AAX1Q439_9BACI|nr:hypothetical protein [Priestia endophytica]KAB2496623.1 hypothetical protein F8155_03340 [Priestia endophytica]KYG31015.1 hypothetical protein AZF06_04480 [Priestia endophytica]MBG9811060.1 hypothetical protein [Priestia endophytica]MBG9813577.1 hypothetical protein [Priestia endophytica]MCM3536357.1 hypothetical protein [Priestia endophytica]
MGNHFVKSAVEVLANGFNIHPLQENALLFKYMEELCCKENTLYLLDDLEAVAEAIREYDAYLLIDLISLYDCKAAQQLDVLVLED